MLDSIADRLKVRRRRKRDEEFARAIEEYRRTVLTPLGLNPATWKGVVHKKNRRVFLGEDRVWKFFRSTQRKYAKNFAAAAEIAASSGVAAPKLCHADVSKKTREKYRLCSLVMERIEGRELTGAESAEMVGRFAAFLGGLHRIRADRWGECHNLREDGYFEIYFQADVAREQELIDRWIRSTGSQPLPDLAGWFAARRELAEPMDCGFSFVSGDAHPHNFMLRTDGAITLIDLDRTRFLDFPLDLIYVLFFQYDEPLLERRNDAQEMMRAVEDSAEEFLEPYFRSVPGTYLEHWRKVREVFFVRVMVRDLWSLLKSTHLKYRPFAKKDPREILRVAENYLHNIRVFVREP